MQAGRLRHQVVIQATSRVSDGMGGWTENWIDQTTVYAEIDPPKGREFFASGQTQSEITTRVRIRYLSGVTPAKRVKFGSRFFDISSVINPDERNRELILMCVER